MQQRQCFLCAETYLQVRLFITQAVDGFRFINQSVKKQLYGIEHFIISNTTYNKVAICRIFSTAAVQNEIQPFFGIRIKGAGHPVDVRFAPTVAKRRPQEVRWTSALCRPKRQRRPRKSYKTV